MIERDQAPEKERRDWVIILIILLIGFLCVILAGGWAIRFAPTWRLDTDMGSNIDPNSDFLTNRPSEFLEPLDPSILTQPAWINVFLTPGASFETSIPLTSLPTNTPFATNTALSTLIPPTNTPVGPSPTNTLPVFLPPTNTPKPPTNTPIPSADLAVTKDDGNTSYLAGSAVTYTITVINNGPNNVIGAVLTDNKPAQITTWSWACTSQTGGASGCNAAANSSTNFTDTVDLPNGASIIYTVTANVSGSATGNLVNTATIGVPAGYSDTVPGNNSSTDTNTLTTISADLSITKDDGVTVVNNGDTVTYTVRVTNSGPDTVTGAILSDPAVAGLNKTGVLCSGTPGQCITPPSIVQLESGTFALPTLNNGQFYEISITANVTATSGSVTNTAAITVPTGVTDPTPGNNSVDDTNTVNQSADLSITITDNTPYYKAGDIKLLPGTAPYAYTITVSNAGPTNVTGATVSNIFSNGNIDPTTIVWGCNPLSACTPPGGLGNNINTLVNVNSGSSVTIYLAVQVIASPSGNLVNDVTVTAPSGITDPVPGNNSATDSDILISTTYGDIGTGQDDVIQDLPAGGPPLTLALSQTITIGTHPGPDIIYYERDLGGYIQMDWVILEVSSDGSTWYPILNWGDTSDNPGTNITWSAVSPPNNTADCSGEPDNCNIDAAVLNVPILTNGAGITIDLDALGTIPNGTVLSYIRITVPPGGLDAGTGVDGIYVIP